MRVTHVSWWCGYGHKNDGVSNKCEVCGSLRRERHAQVHSSERCVVYYNPATGEHRTPPRADMPMPPQYERQGFERREIMNMTSWEKESGSVHEATNFLPGNEVVSNDPIPPKRDPKVIHDLAKDMAEAFASGPWTGAEKLVELPCKADE